ncbi:MAG: carbohydrate ABC transporter permease [Acidimicrobiia bacterium]
MASQTTGRWREANRPPRAVGRRKLTPYLYVIPALALFVLLVLWPFVHGAWLSLFEWDGVSEPVWVGFDNYRRLASDAVAIEAFFHSLVLVAFFVSLPLLVGLVLASAIVTLRVRGQVAFRAIIFLPQVLSLVVVGVTWNWVLARDGPVNQLLGAVGLDALQRTWLGDFTWALPSVGVIGSWALTGLYTVLFVAAMQQISPSLYDACRVDGGGRFRELLSVTIPGVKGQIAIATTISIVTALRYFDIVFVTTRGGPGTSTFVPGYLLYQRAFVSGDFGSSFAIGVILFLLVVGVVVVVNRLVTR